MVVAYHDLSDAAKDRAREASRNYYHSNKAQQQARNKLWRTEHKEWIKKKQRERKREHKEKAIAYLGGVCKRCSNSFHPAVFEFHHRNPAEKDADPSKLLTHSWPRVVEELDKCDLLCANCHRLTHHESWQ